MHAHPGPSNLKKRAHPKKKKKKKAGYCSKPKKKKKSGPRPVTVDYCRKNSKMGTIHQRPQEMYIFII